MSAPTVIDVPHNLDRAEVRRRLKSRIGELAGFIPGGMADVTSTWPSEDRMALDVAAMGQHLSATIDIEDRLVRVSVILPPMLSFMAGPIAAAIRSRGEQLLLG